VPWQPLVLLASIVGFGFCGLLTGRAAVALIPALGLVGFLAVMLSSHDLYSRMPEEVQAYISFCLLIGVAAAIVGVLISRITRSRGPRAA
jgi:hypothetical protein